MKHLILTLSCFLSLAVNFPAQAKRNEIGISIRNTIYSNKVRSEGVGDFTKGKATFGQSALIEYTRLSKSNLLFSLGMEFGYQPYSFVTNFPFQQFGFIEPTNKGEQYNIKQVMYFIRPNVVFGYRFNKVGKIVPELRLGHMFHMPISHKSLDAFSSEYYSTDVPPERNFVRTGALGKPNSSSGLSMEMVNFVYLGIGLPTTSEKLERVSLGVQVQKKILFQNNPFNRFRTDYFDASGNMVGSESFSGKHVAYSIVLGITL